MSTPPKSKRCTIKDVAAEAEVSISTGSLAMSGKGYVRADTRARVLKAARAAVEHLLDRGHRRIAFIGADMEHPSLRSRLDGYRLALNTAGLTPDPTLIITAPQGNPDRETGMLLGEQLLACKPRPTAVFCVNDALTLGVLDLASRQDIAVPDTLAVVGFDDVDGAKNATPALSTVRVFKEQLGELALRYLTELIAGHTRRGTPYKRGYHAIKVPTEMVVRASSNVMRNTA